MAGREAGHECAAPSDTPGREKCFCNLTPLHFGSQHWCFGHIVGGDHEPHAWAYADDFTVPKPVTMERIVACPNCGAVFDAEKATRSLKAVVQDGPVVQQPVPGPQVVP